MLVKIIKVSDIMIDEHLKKEKSYYNNRKLSFRKRWTSLQR